MRIKTKYIKCGNCQNDDVVITDIKFKNKRTIICILKCKKCKCLHKKLFEGAEDIEDYEKSIRFKTLKEVEDEKRLGTF